MSRLLPCASLAVLLVLPSARAGDIHVPADHSTIQAAIEASVDGDTIHIAAGTWTGTISFLDRDVTLQGAGADLTVIDGEGAAQTVLGGIFPTIARLNDVAITGGQVGVTTNAFAQVHLLRCTIRDNAGVGAAGTIYATDCDFLDNGGTGLAAFQLAAFCTFKGNGGWGAEHVTGQTNIAIGGCRFLGNALGGARLAAAGGNWAQETTTAVYTSLFVGDKLQLSASNPDGNSSNTVSRCTFDTATIKAMNGHLSLEYVIARGPLPVQSFASPDFGATYSNIEGHTLLAFQHNIDADPLWTNPAAGDYSLQPGSPCINIGDPFDPSDPDGSTSDMGAIPYQPWTDLGGGVAGGVGLASLTGEGGLVAGDELSLSLASAQGHSPKWLLLGLAELGAPFKGGTLWPVPSVIAGPFPTTEMGTLELAGTWPDGLPSGFTFTTQMWWADAGAPQGWASSNGLRGVQP